VNKNITMYIHMYMSIKSKTQTNMSFYKESVLHMLTHMDMYVNANEYPMLILFFVYLSVTS
jgi:tRNA A37 threonylcarbamoyladenosine biosynthesis protein TsaE